MRTTVKFVNVNFNLLHRRDIYRKGTWWTEVKRDMVDRDVEEGCRKNAVWTETQDEDMVDRNIGRGHWTQVKEENMANTAN